MPSARLLLQMPPGSQSLQILRSVTTTTAAAFHSSCASSSRTDRANRSGGNGRRSCRYASTVATASPTATLLPLSSALRPECEACPRTRQHGAAFGTAATSQRASFPRHGTAVAPLSPEKEEAGLGDSKQTAQRPQQETVKPESSSGDGSGTEAASAEEQTSESAAERRSRNDVDEDDKTVTAASAGPADVIELGPPTTPEGPIEAIFGGSAEGGDPPQQGQQKLLSQRQPPHLAPPPYVHHFDSYSLVRQLASSGYTQAQAITAMKAVRGLLGRHLDVAQSGLVSKSDVENEAYLFKAACAELGIEVRNNRRRADEQMRQQRALLQHEVDIVAQTVSQELLTLNDVVRGLFDDRKMAVREEQKAAESQIQKLNYKITIMLNSEMRSQIEGLRWVLIRRSVLGIIFMVIVSLGSLRYASYRSRELEKEKERQRQLQLDHQLEADQAARAAEAALRSSADAKTNGNTLPEDAEFLTAN
ncbi:hypothetical protein CMQ_4857 [Grosmannia clavigera kw1407]|uniref:Moz protein represents a chromatin-associated acetyltransferase n=1 Tax=Grosmannia clavigera (strain kw1407 / UAMH 11150) TaxID=655863 RepID=F0XUB5_GROCL|nr:uncharacterized protein CMQ_4857 [Grosmannia clavigera kw1407]EFW99005.1 hypothetical protein CMQ_4857 [Grosmannia clavigera kw1407]